MSLASPSSSNSGDRHDLQSPTAVLTESLLSTKASAAQVKSPPPAKDKNSPEALAAKAATRDKVLDEISSTERLYLSSLQLIQSVYAKPLQQPNLQNDLGVTPAQIKTIFSNLDALSGFHVILEEELRSALTKAKGDEKVVQVSKVFEKYGDFLRMYTSYVNNYQQSLQQLTALLSNKKWSKWLQDQKSKSKDMDLMSLLIMPVQRIPRYELLLREVARQSNGTIPELEAAMTKIAEIAVHINETKRLVDRVADLLAIQARLAGSLPSDVDLFIAGSLYSPHRRLVREGDLISKKEKKRKHYLFNDCLLWTNSHEKYKSHIAMRNVEVGQVDAVDGQDFSTAFQLTTHIPTIDGFKVGEKIVLFCSSTYEKDGWLKDLEAAIDEAEEAASAHASANGLSGVVLPTRVRRMSDMNKAANAARESSKSVQMDSVTEVASPESSSTNTSVAEPAETTPKSTPTKPNGRAMSSGGGKLERTNSLTGGKFHDRSPSHGSATRLSGKPNDRAPSIGSASKLNGRTNSDSLRNSLGVTSPDPPRAVSPALAARLSTSRRGSTQPPAKEGRESPAVMEAVPIQQEAPVEPTPAAAAAPASSSSSSKPAVAAAAPTALSPSRIPRIDVSAAPAEPQEPATPDSPSTAAQKEWSRASQAMYRISRSDLTGLKSMKTPVPNLKCAMEALGCLVGAGDLPGSGAANGATTPRGSSAKRSNLHTADDWTSLHALLVKPNFLTILREFNERQAPVTERADKKIASLVDIPTMSEASITKASPAVGVLWTWVLSYWKLKKVNGQDAVFMPPATPSSLPRPSSARLSLFEKPSVSAGPSATPRTSGASKLAPQTPRGGAGASPAPSPTSRPASASIYRIHRKNTSSVSSVSSITSNMSTLSTQSEAVGGSRSSRGNLASLATSSTSRGPGSSTTRVGGVKITLISGRPLSAAVSTTPSVPKENLPLPPFSELVKCKTQFNQDRMVNYYHPPTKTFYEAHVSAPVDFFLLEGPKLAKVKVSEAAHAARLKAAASPKRPKEGENAPPPSTFGKSESRAVTPAPESNGSAAGSGSRLPTSRASTTHEIKAKLPASASSSSSSTSGSSSSKKKHIVSVKPASSTEVKPSTSRSSSLKKHRLSSALPAKKEGE